MSIKRDLNQRLQPGGWHSRVRRIRRVEQALNEARGCTDEPAQKRGSYVSSLWIALLLIVALQLLASISCLAQDAPTSTSFEEANKLYAQGKFVEAIASYDSLLKSDEISAPLLFNLGNAYFKAGQIGQAIAAYRQAQALTPRDPDIQANLKFARNGVGGPTRSDTKVERILGKLSLNEWTIAVSSSLALFWLLLAFGQLRPALGPTLRPYVAGVAALTVTLGICVGLGLSSGTVAIVVQPDAPVRQAPITESKLVFKASDGAELRVIDRKGDWLQVSMGPNRLGWIQAEQVRVLKASGIPVGKTT